MVVGVRDKYDFDFLSVLAIGGKGVLQMQLVFTLLRNSSHSLLVLQSDEKFSDFYLRLAQKKTKSSFRGSMINMLSVVLLFIFAPTPPPPHRHGSVSVWSTLLKLAPCDATSPKTPTSTSSGMWSTPPASSTSCSSSSSSTPCVWPFRWAEFRHT